MQNPLSVKKINAGGLSFFFFFFGTFHPKGFFYSETWLGVLGLKVLVRNNHNMEIEATLSEIRVLNGSNSFPGIALHHHALAAMR